jgi:hypothetical protein
MTRLPHKFRNERYLKITTSATPATESVTVSEEHLRRQLAIKSDEEVTVKGVTGL